MAKAKGVSTESYKGVRDFYPEDMAVQQYIFSVWRTVVESFGYAEYGASVLEYADLYKAKSGEEIVNEQTYTFVDKGEREVSLRPEMTPTVARLIAAKAKSFQFPLRWYSIPNLFRYENPQKGRTREHWQLNVDIFGVKNLNAEIEIISMASALLRTFGLKDVDFEIRINSRKLTDYILRDVYILSEEDAHRVAKLLDRKAKIPADDFNTQVKEIIPSRGQEFIELMASKNFPEFISRLPKEALAQEGIADIQAVIDGLEKLGIANVSFAQDLMRGFDYYTGIVFEIFDTNPDNRRSLFGGGRYDDLLSIFGVDPVSAVGFGIGDVVLKEALLSRGLLPELKPTADLAVLILDEVYTGFAQDIAQRVREGGMRAIVDYSGKKVGDQIKYADKNKIPFVVIIGEEEVKTGKLKVKHLATGQETEATQETIAEVLK